MKTPFRYIVRFFILALIAGSNQVGATGISLFTENFKPYQFVDDQGDVKGFGVELVEAIFKEAGIEVDEKIRLGVWENVYQAVLSDANAGLFMTVRNDKREGLFKWVGPLAPRKMWLYKLRKRDDIQIETLEDAKEYLVGAYKSAQSDYLIDLGFPKLDIVLKEELNFEKLLAGRIDLVPSLEVMMVSKLKDKGLPIDAVEKTVVFDHRYDYYLALNSDISDDIVMKLQQALLKLISNGIYKEIEQKYLTDVSR